MKDLFLGMILAGISTLVGAFGALFFKYSSSHVNNGMFFLFKKPALYFGFLLYGLSALIFVYTLRFGDLSALYPLAGLSYVWVSFLSIWFLKEKMNEIKWFGIILILVGVVLIGMGA
jgi:uncharacterized membrane protein